MNQLLISIALVLLLFPSISIFANAQTFNPTQSIIINNEEEDTSDLNDDENIEEEQENEETEENLD